MNMSNPQCVQSAKESFFSALVLLFMLVDLPFGSTMIRTAGGVLVFTAYLWCFPDSLRSRKGSLIPAYCLAGLQIS